MTRPKWEEALFQTSNGARYGSCWGGWAVHHGRGRRYTVYRIAGGRLTEFDSLRCARRFCEAIDGLTDWSRPTADIQADPAVGRAMHRLALKITGARPDLHLVN